MPIYNGIINQKGTPAFYSDIFANRPAFGYAGRVFISTDTGAIYEDTGTSWTLIADAGAGTTGTLQQVTTNGNTTTLGVTIQGIDINDGAGTGTENTAIGKSSLVNNTTGINNTALGSYSLGFNTTGANNVAVGVNALQNNTTANSNTAIGTNALQNNTTGTQNNALGTSALQNNTTGTANTAVSNSALGSNTTGINNTAIGVSALQNNTTASFNTAIGVTSLQLNTTGGSNTALGYQSLNANTTGANNTALGLSALSGNTTASNNTAIGHSSLLNNTTGANNSAVGYVSLAANTTGGGNAALGFQSLTNNTTGTNNTSVGSGALSNNTTGISNTAIGSSSLAANITGSYNVALGVGTLGNNLGSYNVGIGHSSLNAVTTGTNNSAIGYASGSAITTGSNNTIIGGYGGTTTLASNIVLSDGAGNVRLFSDANGLIGINQSVGSVPGGQLDIHTTQTYALVLNGLTTSNAYTAFSNNSVGKWRIGNTYNAGANSFDIFNLGTSAIALSINSTTNNAVFSGNVGANGSPGTNFPLEAYINSATAYTTSSRGNVFRCFNSNSAANIFAGIELGGSGPANDGLAGFNAVVTSTGSAALTFYTRDSNTFAEKMRITSGGNVGIGDGTITPTSMLHIYKSSAVADIALQSAGGSGKKYIFQSNTDGSLAFYDSNAAAERIRIISTGEIGIGTTPTAGNKLVVKGTSSTSGNTTIIAQNSSGTNSFYVRDDSAIFFKASYPFTTAALANMVLDSSGVIQLSVSSLKYKKDINNYDKGLNEVLKLRPVTFKSKNSLTDGDKIFAGFIAEEIDELGLSEFVIYSQDKTPNALAYSNMTALLTKAIQELNDKLVRNNIN